MKVDRDALVGRDVKPDETIIDSDDDGCEASHAPELRWLTDISLPGQLYFRCEIDSGQCVQLTSGLKGLCMI